MTKPRNPPADSAVGLDNETVFVLHPQIGQQSNLTLVDAISYRLYHIRAMCNVGIDAYSEADDGGHIAPFLGRISNLAGEAETLVNVFHKGGGES